MASLKYLSGYAPELQQQIQSLLDQNTLEAFQQKKCPVQAPFHFRSCSNRCSRI